MRHFLSAFPFLFVCLFSSCNKEGSKDTISIQNQEDLTPYFDVQGGSKSVMFFASSEWTAVILNDMEHDWVSVTPSNGPGGESTLFITTKENLTTDDRTATIEIRCGSTKKQILATQRQKNALMLTKSKFDVRADGETIHIEVKANVSYSVAIDDKCADWIEKSQTKSMQTTTFDLIIAKNEDTGKREGKVIVSDGTISESIIIAQQGAVPTITVSKHDYVVSSSGETIEMEVRHNVNVSISYSSPWVSLVSTKGMTVNTYTFSVAANEGYEGREAEIKFVNTTNGISETVKIMQLQKDAIVYSKNEYFVPRSGGYISAIIGHNVEFSTSINVGWITETDTRSFTSDTLRFFVSENSSGQERIGEITFTSSAGKIRQTVKVTQSINDYINLSVNGTANCYIVSAPGTYGFNGRVKGNSTESIGNPVYAEVLWESFGTSTAPNVGDIIKSVSYNNGVICFSTPETLRNGNAVIAVKDNTGTILWSWHIWVCDGYDPVNTQQVYSGGAVVMDRYLGAVSIVHGDVKSFGVLYQWGRKDPFIGGNGVENQAVYASTTLTWPNPVPSSVENGTLKYAAEHPATFIYSSSHWTYADDNSLWGETKTINDPCPQNWKVAPESVWDGFPFGYTGHYSTSEKGGIFDYPYSSPSAYYSRIQRITEYGKLLPLKNSEGPSLWTSSGKNLDLGTDGQFRFWNCNEKAGARSVRCCKEHYN